jgi:hypothetical protein
VRTGLPAQQGAAPGGLRSAFAISSLVWLCDKHRLGFDSPPVGCEIHHQTVNTEPSGIFRLSVRSTFMLGIPPGDKKKMHALRRASLDKLAQKVFQQAVAKWRR